MKWTVTVMALLISGQTHAEDTAVRPSKNIALGASYHMEPVPQYEYCTDNDDTTQLTDGDFLETEESLWTHRSTVGWQDKERVILTLDLGAVKPIRGIALHTAAGRAGVNWPQEIRVLTADEDKAFHEIGELVGLSAKRNTPSTEKYATHWYWTDQLRTHGRYVRLAVQSQPFTFLDEIEIYAGEPEWVNEPLPGSAFVSDNAKAFVRHLAIQSGIHTRLQKDIEALKIAAEEAHIPAVTKRKVLAELAAVEAELGPASNDYKDDFKAVLPLNAWHQRVLRTQAWLWRAQDFGPLTFWQSNLWDPLPLIGTPNTSAPPAVEVHLMRKEYRAAAFNVSNSNDHSEQVSFRLSRLPGGDNPEYVTVHEVQWTDTAEGVPVATALSEIQVEDNLYTMTVPSGMTRQIWLTFHPVHIAPDAYEGEVIVESTAGEFQFPLRMHLYPLDFPEKQSLHLGGWDYTDRLGHFPMITEKTYSLIIQHLRERLVDSPWGGPWLLPRGTYDARGKMTAPPDTTMFDAWLEAWPDAAQYFIFAKVGDRFAYPGDKKYSESWIKGTPEFTLAVKQWVTFWAEHVRAKGLQPEQFALELVDEPDENPPHDDRILGWAKAIRAAKTGIRVWENPNHLDMNHASEAMIDACHVLCPHSGIFLNTSRPIRPPQAGQAYRDYYEQKRDNGIELQFYNADGPVRIMDPYAYYRLMAWTSWRYEATTMFFWSLTDTAGVSSWNEYLASGRPYSPLFLTKDSVTTSKHLEAMREGVEDYEYFVMLQQAIKEAAAQGRAGTEVDLAGQLLESLPVSVCEAAAGEKKWHRPNVDRTLADEARIQVLAALTALTEQ